MGNIQILKNRAGKYYVRVKHQNGRILCHCQAVESLSTAYDLADELQFYISNNPLCARSAYHTAKNSQPYFSFFCEVSSHETGKPLQRTFFSETYSSRQKAEQGLNAVIRICKAGVIEVLTKIQTP
jgi:uncharacterized protein YegP (UPF0339 family)